MGESTTITHAILTIAAVTIASIFAFVMLTKISALNSSVSQMIYSNVNSMESSVTIIDFYYSSQNQSFIVFVKNTGSMDISPSFSSMTDVYLGTYGQGSVLYTYASSPSLGHWSYTKTQPDPSWKAGETIIIYIYNTTTVLPPYQVKVVMPNGVGAEMVRGG
ncbi:MAG: hypothetical protein C0179_08570 [Fervidicoccus sp.]|nr:MAG: hypothetical protein C0179_08570 [Fervidicoccus sp.]